MIWGTITPVIARILFFILLAATAQARSPHRETVGFNYVSNTGIGRSLYVVGNHQDVGLWDPAQAVRLYWTPGNVWTGGVAIQSGTPLEFKYIARADGSAEHCASTNVEWMSGANLATQVVAQPDAPYTGKTILYHSGWTSAAILYKSGTSFLDAAMTRIGAGRNGTEYLYRVTGIGEAGEGLEFIPHGFTPAGVEQYDNAAYGGFGLNNYYTRLDVFFVQDKSVFNYWPPPTVSVSRMVTTNVLSSWDPPVSSRTVRIYLPRGYDQNTWKRYPVLYMHDGQNVFAPGGAFGCWGAESAADREISQGRMRETIIVGIDNTGARMREYVPPTDAVSGEGAGFGDLYANYVVHNVRPTVDFHYRTTNDPPNTGVLGSSLGGLISSWMALKTNVFGRAGPMSPSFWTANNFVTEIEYTPVQVVRTYLDWGTDESDGSMWYPGWNVYGLLLADGYVVNRDLHLAIGCGHEHNEAAWSNRIHLAYRFLFDPMDEPNRLAHDLYPPDMTNAQVAASGSAVTLRFAGLAGWTYVLERSDALTGTSWQAVATSEVASLPWSNRALADSNAPSAGRATYRLRGL
jgi:predicted alpha/beta superfamily hydrolase